MFQNLWVLTLDLNSDFPEMSNQNFENWERTHKSKNGKAIIIHMARRKWIDCVPVSLHPGLCS